MLFLGVLIYIFDVFVQPQLFIPAVKGWQVDKIVMGTVLVLWILGMLKTRKNYFLNTQQNKLMIMFYFIIAVSTISVSWLSYSYNTIIDWGKIVLIYFVFINIINTFSKLKIVIWTAVLSLTITALLGILQIYGIDYYGTGLSHGRISGIGIFSMNQLAHVLAFLMPMILYLLLTTRNYLLKLVILVIFIEYYYAIFLTQSRGGILCSVIIVLLFFLIVGKSKLIKIIGPLLAIGIYILFLQISPRMQTIADYNTDASSKGRLDVWGEALMVVKSSPLVGVGKDQFLEHASRAPHNSYIQLLTELGLFGLFTWLALFYYSFKNLKYVDNYENKLVNKDASILAKCFQISLCAYLISSFFSGSAYYEILFIFFALIVVLQILTNTEKLNGNRVFVAKDIVRILFAEAVIVLAIRLLV